MEEQIKRLQEWIDGSESIVFFGGAGVSTESGIPDFRSVDGLYNQKYDYPPEEILSRTFFDRRPEEFYRFYRDKMLCLDARPNMATRSWPSWSEWVSSAQWSPRTLTGCTRWPGQSGCGSCMARSTGISVCAVKSPIPWNLYVTARGYPPVPVGGR